MSKKYPEAVQLEDLKPKFSEISLVEGDLNRDELSEALRSFGNSDTPQLEESTLFFRSGSLDYQNKAPVLGSREVQFLGQLLARLRDYMGLEKSPYCISYPDASFLNHKLSYAEEEEVLLCDGQKKFFVKNGMLEVYAKIPIGEGKYKMVHLFNLGPGAMVGGGELGHLQGWQIPEELIILKVAKGEYVNPDVPIEQSIREMQFRPFYRLLSDLDVYDIESARYLSKTFNQLRQSHVIDFKYGSTVSDFEKLEGDRGLGVSCFKRSLDIAARQVILKNSPFRKGVELSGQKSKINHIDFNQRVMIPAICSQIRALKSQMEDGVYQGLFSEASAYYQGAYKTKECTLLDDQDKALVIPSTPLHLIENPEALIVSPRLAMEGSVSDLDQPGEGHELPAEEIEFICFLKAADKYATPEIIKSYIKHHQLNEDVQQSLISKGYLLQRSGQLFLTLEGFRQIGFQDEDLSQSMVHSYLVDYFLQKKDWFFVIELLCSSDNQLKEAVGYMSCCKKGVKQMLKSLLQSPHPYLPNEIQERGLEILGNFYSSDVLILNQIKRARISNAYSDGKYQKAVILSEDYFCGAPEVIASKKAHADQMETIVIYIESLIALADWEKIICFFDHYGYQFPDQISYPHLVGLADRLIGWSADRADKMTNEKKFWQEHLPAYAKLRKENELADSFYAAAGKAADELSEAFEMLKKEQSVSLVTLWRFNRDLQQLYLAASKAVSTPDEKEEILKKVIECASFEGFENLSPKLKQALVMNKAIAYRNMGDYLKALRCFDEAATDSRGLVHQLNNSSLILDRILADLERALELGDHSTVQVQTFAFCGAIKFLCINKLMVPEGCRKNIKRLLEQLERVIGGGDQLSLEFLKQVKVVNYKVGYYLNELGIITNKRLDLPNEAFLNLTNAFDSLFYAEEVYQQNFDDKKKLPPKLDQYYQEDDLLIMASTLYQMDLVFNESLSDQLLAQDNLTKAFKEHMIKCRLTLLNWLQIRLNELSDQPKIYFKYSEVRAELIQSLLGYFELIKTKKEVLYPDGKGYPKQLSPRYIGRLKKILEKYNQEKTLS